ncbi:substrate-binding periplasmic protein [Colwellia sp. E150_009]
MSFAQNKISADLQVVAFSNPLLQYQENGEHKGPTIEILNALLKETQLSADIAYIPWARAVFLAENIPNTLILSMFRTPEREDNFHWIIKVSQAARVFISLKSKPESYVETMEQAKKKLTAVILGSAAHKELISAGFSEQENIYIVSDSNKMLNLLLNGRVDLIYSDPNNVETSLQAINQSNITISYKKITIENQRMGYIALNKNSDEKIVNQLQQAAAEFSKTPEYNRLLNE